MTQSFVESALEAGKGILRLAPTWVPRALSTPGRRLRLHHADLYPYGAVRGGISERWFASATKADNGPLTRADEGLSYIEHHGQRVTLAEALALSRKDLLGEAAEWLVLTKFFDNYFVLPLHIHQDDARAAEVGKLGKPEAYFYPEQYNPTLNTFPFTYFGLDPSTTQAQIVECLKRWEQGDNGIIAHSKAYRLELGTGWFVPTGTLHGPGSLCTYEPQRASDVGSMWQSLIADHQVLDRRVLTADMPTSRHDDYDYMLSLLDWDVNTSANFRERFFCPPIETTPQDGYRERWIVYGSAFFSAKELTVAPQQTVTVRDSGAYGVICVQGYGQFGAYPVSSPTLIRFGQMSEDEFFVSAGAAQTGVTIRNYSSTEPLVLLKHFNADHADAAPFIKA